MMFTAPVLIDERTGGFDCLQEAIKGKRVFVVADNNTEKFCLPFLAGKCDTELILVIAPGETSKSVETCRHLWSEFLKYNLTRQDVVLALGGGCVLDIAGFAAAVFKRGITFIAVPTTLLAMTDAAIGGKNGVDFEGYKNMLGTISQPAHIFVWPGFLQTLPADELLNGYAETLKHALIADAGFWDALPGKITTDNAAELIGKSSAIKSGIVKQDITEKSVRKLLNFGHTVGHAIESWYLKKNKPVLHGFAIAAGMCIESLISADICGLKEEKSLQIVTRIKTIFAGYLPEIPPAAALKPFLAADKKNVHHEMRFTLLQDIGSGIFDITVNRTQLESALKRFHDSL